MSNALCSKTHAQNRLDDRGTASLSGPITDQAALHGVLNRIRDLGIEIISVQRIGPKAKAIGEENS